MTSRMCGVTVRARDVAALARTSRSHVSNYFNNPDLVSNDAKVRIRAAIDELGYVRDESARQLRVGSNRILGLVLLDAWAPFFSEVAQEVEEQALGQGWQVQMANSARSEDREKVQLDGFEARRVAGLIVVPQGDVVARLERLVRSGTACVLFDPSAQDSVNPLVPSVGVDHRLGGRLAAGRLLERGATHLGFVGDAHRSRASRDRLAGFREGAGDRLVTVIRTDDLGLGHGTRAAVDVLSLPVAERPDALFVGNDITAIGLVHALLVGGLSVPEDVAVIGYDDIALADQIAVPLTTVRQPVAALASRATRMITDRPRTQGDEHVLLEPSLVVRASA